MMILWFPAIMIIPALFEDGFTYASPSEIDTVEGQIAILPCLPSVHPTSTPLLPTLLRWFRTGQNRPIYALDTRFANWTHGQEPITISDRLTLSAKHYPSPESEGRLFVEIKGGSILLRIDPVLARDRGRYTCVLDFKDRRSIFHHLHLRVVVPAKGVVIRDSNGTKVGGVLGSLNLGDVLYLSCTAIGGQPPPKVQWSRNDRFMKSNISIGQADLSMPLLRRSDQWSHFTCSSWNSNLTAPVISTITLELNLPPAEARISSSPAPPLRPGQEVLLTCESRGSYPRAATRWTLDDRPLLTKERVVDNGNVTRNLLRRTVTAGDNGRIFQCEVTNPAMDAFVLRKLYYLDVRYLPEVQLHVIKHTPSLQENVTLFCEISSNPPPHTRQWTHNGKSIIDSESVHISGNYLYITQVSRHHVGNYTCFASNAEGSGKSTIYLHVHYPPECETIDQSPSLEGANVTCKLRASPRPSAYTWAAINNASNRTWGSGPQPWTAIALDAGPVEVLCWGSNGIGPQEIPCALKIDRGSTSGKRTSDIMIMTSFAVIVCFIVILVFIRKPRHKYSQDIFLKRKVSKGMCCGQNMKNCVNSTNSSTELESVSKLLKSASSNDQNEEDMCQWTDRKNVAETECSNV